MKKHVLVSIMCMAALLFLLNGCGGGKYADVIKLNQEYIGLVETYIADLDKAGNAKDVAKAMNRFADGLEKVWPRMEALSEKYPELEDRDNQPEELKASQQEAEALGMKMGGTFMKVMPYMEDPDVQKAQQRLSKIMGE